MSETDARRRVIERAMRLGMWMWPAFGLLDIFMVFAVYPEAPLWPFVVCRVCGELVLFGTYRASRSPWIPTALVDLARAASFFVLALGIVLMATYLGGVHSPYVHGLSVLILVHATAMPARWQRSLYTFVPGVLTFPAVMAIVVARSPAAREAWLQAPALAAFFSHYVFVLSSVVIAAATGHAVWAAEEQVYKARRLGRYRLEAPIGRGGMGEVWLAWDEGLRRNVALKLLRIGHGGGPARVRRFEREARAASSLRAEHTIRIFDFGASDDGIYYLAMEYLPGADLAALVQGHGALPAARVVRFGLQVCSSLIEAHEAGVVHRDIKPQNLYVTRVGDDWDFLKLLDFGIARVVADSDAPVTRTGAVPGTPEYIAPELWQGAAADARSDLYSLGATLYFLLTGATPPREKPVPRPSVLRGQSVPAALEEVIGRCLAARPETRYATARELHDALAACADSAAWTRDDAREFWQVARPTRMSALEQATQ